MKHERKTPYQEWVVKEDDTFRESSNMHKIIAKETATKEFDCKRIDVYLQCN
jgi:hypothetical protein